MVRIKKATEANAEVIALLGTLTYKESHGHFIEDKNDLKVYVNAAFSVSTTKHSLKDTTKRFYIIYVHDLPVGYAQLDLNANHKGAISPNSCRIERIYILADFIPLKIGQQFLTFLEEEAKELQIDTISLSVYTKNNRAIRFYERNDYKNVGSINFLVNGKEYENIVFLKSILN